MDAVIGGVTPVPELRTLLRPVRVPGLRRRPCLVQAVLGGVRGARCCVPVPDLCGNREAEPIRKPRAERDVVFVRDVGGLTLSNVPDSTKSTDMPRVLNRGARRFSIIATTGSVPARTARAGVGGTAGPSTAASRRTRDGARSRGGRAVRVGPPGAGMVPTRKALTHAYRSVYATGNYGSRASGFSCAAVRRTTGTPTATGSRTFTRSVTGAADAPPDGCGT